MKKASPWYLHARYITIICRGERSPLQGRFFSLLSTEYLSQTSLAHNVYAPLPEYPPEVLYLFPLYLNATKSRREKTGLK
jgi:hypothetical protein